MIPIVFIHIGSVPPDYARIAVEQARCWNPESPVIFLASVIPEGGYGAKEEWISIADIPLTPEHTRFQETTLLDTTFRNGFWRYTTERLFVLDDWLRWKGVQECLHMEYDNMLYRSVEELAPILRATSKGLSVPFHGPAEARGRLHVCFSIVYCNDVTKLSQFLFYLAASKSRTDEMQRAGEFWLENIDDYPLLPTVPPGTQLISETYRGWYENPAFPCVFDAAAHGQFLGGDDPRNGGPEGPYVNLDVDYRTDSLEYVWRVDGAGRKVPVILERGGKEWPIVNLHIHSKRLGDFL
jgi:hypothetical protein